jgi:hypothetical protein
MFGGLLWAALIPCFCLPAVCAAQATAPRTAEIALTWSGRADLDLVIVDPAGQVIDSDLVRVPGDERLPIAAPRAFGRWLVCVFSRRGAADFDVVVRVGERSGTTSGNRARAMRDTTCSEESPGFVTAVSLGAPPASGPSSPTTSSSVYTSAITVSTTQTIKAFATLTNWVDSSVSTATYTINGSVVTPTASPSAGT